MVPDVKFWFGDYHHSKGMYNKAKEYFSSILRDYPSSGIIEETLYQLALTLSDEGRIDEATARFEELADRFPGSDMAKNAYRKIAKLKKDRHDFDSAIKYFRKALTDENNELNAQVQYEIAECLDEKGDFSRATEEYLKTPYLYPKGTFWSVRAQLKCAQDFERINKLDEAKKLYEKLANMDIEESAFAKQRLDWIRWRTTK